MITLITKFMIYAILGYVVEVSYVFIGHKKWINRGFLNGPYIPIYAFGSLLTVYFLKKYYADPLIVFFMGMIICSGLEYFTSHVMEKIFNRRWWDYSYLKYNLNGRIALKNSILFGIGCLVILYLIDPLISSFIKKVNPKIILALALIFIVIFIIDLSFSSVAAYKTSKNIIHINKFLNIGKKQKELLSNIKTRILIAYPYLLKNNEEIYEKILKIKKDIKLKTEKFKKK